ncbi:hypothetical protein [Calidifontibacillus oryziterrae]|uniref:hypothetical protein n=1 Tax=Calidifontibacillus oryziterrae TaxID=1191699 RepID=UPI0002E04117|nr:hypothetical protein [Calidifontibacillus oryziterrae]
MKISEEVLTTFENRQVVVNVYEDEELVKREGFFFDSITISERNINFVKNNTNKLSIEYTPFNEFVKGDTFKDYFILKNGNNYIEIYFP